MSAPEERKLRKEKTSKKCNIHLLTKSPDPIVARGGKQHKRARIGGGREKNQKRLEQNYQDEWEQRGC